MRKYSKGEDMLQVISILLFCFPQEDAPLEKGIRKKIRKLRSKNTCIARAVVVLFS
jgi:hypothetical protein